MNNFCEICPRKCNANRNNKKGFCGAPKSLVVAHADLHFGEEPFISGTCGSGTIFFSHCNLKCVFCQNAILRDGKIGKEISIEHLIEIIKRLEARGAHNINFVSGMHYADVVIEALEKYKPKIPIVWNTNGYETVKMVKKLAKYVDVFLPDLKFFDPAVSSKFASCPNYFEVASKAIIEMRRQKPIDVFNEKGIMTSGVAIRHLVLPNYTTDSKKIIDFLSNNLPNTQLSLMSQYIPFDKAKNYSDINRKLKPIEYNAVLHHAQNIFNGKIFAQDFSSATEDYIPKWNTDEV